MEEVRYIDIDTVERHVENNKMELVETDFSEEFKEALNIFKLALVTEEERLLKEHTNNGMIPSSMTTPDGKEMQDICLSTYLCEIVNEIINDLDYEMEREAIKIFCKENDIDMK